MNNNFFDEYYLKISNYTQNFDKKKIFNIIKKKLKIR